MLQRQRARPWRGGPEYRARPSWPSSSRHTRRWLVSATSASIPWCLDGRHAKFWDQLRTRLLTLARGERHLCLEGRPMIASRSLHRLVPWFAPWGVGDARQPRTPLSEFPGPPLPGGIQEQQLNHREYTLLPNEGVSRIMGKRHEASTISPIGLYKSIRCLWLNLYRRRPPHGTPIYTSRAMKRRRPMNLLSQCSFSCFQERAAPSGR